MGERFDLPKGFPTGEQLETETVNAIKEHGGTATTTEIKDYIVKKLKLSDEVLEFENSDGLTMLIDYRLRWARTSLKNKKLITSETRGVWKSV
ncbi:winged helix-turn-helix domain-containing protein [Lacrimispora saccharolytica]|uniref:winged helix-turn-helix domain-containing protein n=1 Tax=Lacrimispora saccharolytica TaxID=84030 RepID=UPI00265C8F93|nr:winged helix-turn-helix domain-containing protein [Lacrimispora saccharolytica]MCF2657332.1 winged helix-turn-helix domain-containing protein [Lacrimispora saccharolytica]